MPHYKESGKVTLVKGSLAFMWEELKTLNFKKLRAMSKILVGYVRMRYFGTKRLPSP